MTRKQGKRSASLFYIFTEGTVTERLYFEDNLFGAGPRADRKCPQVNKGYRRGQDPGNIRKWVENTTKKNHKKDIVWIVIDKDQNDPEKLRNLKEWCDKKNFRLALSNPAFEYWLALHFQYINENINKEYLDRCLSENLDCNYEKNKCYNEKLSKYTDDAIRNAAKNREDITSDRYCDHNPFTNIDLLVKEIRDYFRSG